MNRRQWMGFWVLAAGVTSINQGHADSIWERRDHMKGFLFIDNRARRVGDTLTVVVNESTDANNTEQRQLKKDTSISGKFDFSGSTGNAGAATAKAVNATVTGDNSTDRSFQGSAQYQSNRQLLDGMQVVVLDMLPNGNLLVEGYRRRTVSNDVRWLRVTGIVRPNDIDIPNNINSQLIANLNLVYEEGGAEARFTNQGFMGRIGNRLWPY